MKNPMIAIVLVALHLAACDRTVDVANQASRSDMPAMIKRSGTHESPGSVIRADWTWTSIGAASAQVQLTIKPSVAAQTLRVEVKLPGGTSIAGGDFEKTFLNTMPNTRLAISFSVAYAANSHPLIPVSVAILRDGQERLDIVIPVQDPDAGGVVPSEKAALPRDIGGLPTRVGGELEPRKK